MAEASEVHLPSWHRDHPDDGCKGVPAFGRYRNEANSTFVLLTRVVPRATTRPLPGAGFLFLIEEGLK